MIMMVGVRLRGDFRETIL
uniref:Uncharacterized protein n=1 Tax=Lepeophtheirus salmonis TaxID=72036 RepID=A0A0K2V0Z6_LEPSM